MPGSEGRWEVPRFLRLSMLAVKLAQGPERLNFAFVRDHHPRRGILGSPDPPSFTSVLLNACLRPSPLDPLQPQKQARRIA